jgi:hypothetical protein
MSTINIGPVDEGEEFRRPRLIDPGADGWPTPPKISRPEVMLYGEYAESVRLLGSAAWAAADAYALACKAINEHSSAGSTSYSEGREGVFEADMVQTLYDLQRDLTETFAQVAAAALRRRQMLVTASQPTTNETRPVPNPGEWTDEPLTEDALAAVLTQVDTKGAMVRVIVGGPRLEFVANRILGSAEAVSKDFIEAPSADHWCVEVVPAV